MPSPRGTTAAPTACPNTTIGRAPNQGGPYSHCEAAPSLAAPRRFQPQIIERWPLTPRPPRRKIMIYGWRTKSDNSFQPRPRVYGHPLSAWSGVRA
jgi:hypothetical protein